MASTSSSLSVTSLGSGSPLQITGLASGLDTNSIISSLISIDQQPITNLQNQQTGLQARNSALTGIQSALQTLAMDAQALSDPTLFHNTQTAASNDPTIVQATTSGSAGAVVGGYQVAVTQLASAAQATYSFPASSASDPADTITITPSTNGSPGKGQTYTLAAGASAQDLANAVNADGSGSVWATVVNGNLVFSDRTTGSASTFTVSDANQAMSLQGTLTPGQDAHYSINGGTTQSSPSNTIANAIPGVNLTLSGLTGSGAPVTVNVSPPSLSSSSIQSALQTFVTQYNAVISQVQTALTQKPSSSDPTQGQLYGDQGLTNLLNSMRQAMYTGGAGLPAGMAAMSDIGVSTGAATGSAAPSQSAISGQLTLNANTLTQALTSNPSGVTAVLKSWSQSFSSLVNTAAEAGGTIDSRIQGDNSESSLLGNQISLMQAALADKQAQLQQEFAALESTLSQNQSQSSWLTSQINSLPGSASSTGG